jgi:activator of HSP90 ATPase
MPKAADSPQPAGSFTRRGLVFAATLGVTGLHRAVAAGAGGAELGVSHSAEAIHQEPSFAATRHAVFDMLTNPKRFDALTRLSLAAKTMAIGAKPAEIDAVAGGAFAVFGGYISGRNIDIVTDELIVQAWRVGSWAPGIYSLARFLLVDRGSSCRIVFDHTGFPAGKGVNLANGWRDNYWQPLAKLLAQAD